jgi:hypothetical protein
MTPMAQQGLWQYSLTSGGVTMSGDLPAHETARQLAHLQNQTMRDWRRVG